jgi:phosphoglycolate phosphatase-like HAD superfamily hydrolase
MRAADGWTHTFRSVIWDIDGTLFDTCPAIARAFKAALADLGADDSLERIADLARVSLGQCATTLPADHRLDAAVFEDAFSRHYASTTPDEQPPFPGARAVCEHIDRIGGRNVIVTHRGAQGTAELLAASHLTASFSGCVTAADGYPRKPDPAAFNAIIERCGLNRDQTLAIGDREIDVLAGRAAGVAICLFGHADPASEADLVVTDFADLLRLLQAPDR